MPSAQPTSAARVIKNPYLKPGWGKPLSKETNQMISGMKNEAGAVYQLQCSRSRPISSVSLRQALFWEHRHLDYQGIVSTPAIDDSLESELFSPEDDTFKAGLDKIKRVDNVLGSVNMHPLFGPMRHRQYTLLPIRISGAWVTALFHIKSVPPTVQLEKVYYDREVVRLVIVDPLPKGRDARRVLIQQRLPEILAQGCIRLPFTSLTQGFATANIQDDWATGHISYAVSREFLRRLKVILFRRDLKDEDTSSDFLFGDFEEHFDLDAYRESLTGACAHRAVERSDYLVRIALEVPSEKSDHRPETLAHAAKEELADEVYLPAHYKIRNVVTELPEGLRHFQGTLRGYSSDEQESQDDYDMDMDEPEDVEDTESQAPSEPYIYPSDASSPEDIYEAIDETVRERHREMALEEALNKRRLSETSIAEEPSDSKRTKVEETVEEQIVEEPIVQQEIVQQEVVQEKVVENEVVEDETAKEEAVTDEAVTEETIATKAVAIEAIVEKTDDKISQ
ncbi:hypothetical protein M426DRAFT_28520 [Hypoxylon sp. CI-4A]|nr:hypothetical protein M426DRAFT_28520 [Hypoxylon sp. CI-4A]